MKDVFVALRGASLAARSWRPRARATSRTLRSQELRGALRQAEEAKKRLRAETHEVPHALP